MKIDHPCQKDLSSNLAACSCENCKYLARTADDSIITFGEIIETMKTVPTKGTSTNILLSFLLITIALLIAVSIYCYLIKY